MHGDTTICGKLGKVKAKLLWVISSKSHHLVPRHEEPPTLNFVMKNANSGSDACIISETWFKTGETWVTTHWPSINGHCSPRHTPTTLSHSTQHSRTLPGCSLGIWCPLIRKNHFLNFLAFYLHFCLKPVILNLGCTLWLLLDTKNKIKHTHTHRVNKYTFISALHEK